MSDEVEFEKALEAYGDKVRALRQQCKDFVETAITNWGVGLCCPQSEESKGKLPRSAQSLRDSLEGFLSRNYVEYADYRKWLRGWVCEITDRIHATELKRERGHKFTRPVWRDSGVVEVVEFHVRN